jgi:uroporphyrinogen decarboxylase
MQHDVFLKACRNQPTSRRPLWIMRQAGRYLPEYRAVREKVDFLTLCQTPELAAQVTLQPIDRFGFDAAILFSDIMMPLVSMGVKMDFAPGPVLEKTISSLEDVQALRVPETDEVAPCVMQTVHILKRELENRVPLIGFCGAPFTLAAYLVQGKGSKEFARLRSFMYAQPQAFAQLMQVLTHTMERYLRAQVLAGAQAVQVFDSWVGLLSERAFSLHVLPWLQKLFASLKDLNVPRIYFAQDAAALMRVLPETGADVLGVDWRTELAYARETVGSHIPLQGNLDPAWLHAPKDALQKEVLRVLESGRGGSHIFNLGHGIWPDAPIENVHAVVDVVKGWQTPSSM